MSNRVLTSDTDSLPRGLRVATSGISFGEEFSSMHQFKGQDPKLLYERKPDLVARPGIVSTVRGMGETLHSWLQYHLEIGFCKVYLYFDDATEFGSFVKQGKYNGDTRCRFFKNDNDLRRSWEALRLWPKFCKFVDEEVQARQELNCEHAVSQALADDVTWLLHIDADELFHCPDTTVKEHFSKLSADGVTVMNYVNHEGVPESSDVANFFHEVTLFKRSLAVLPLQGGKSAMREALDFWSRRSLHGQYFIGYENGKSAVAVVEGAAPLSVHEWAPPTLSLLQRGCHNIRLLDSHGVLSYRESSACILHYIVCGFDWWQRKYRLLGSFADSWFGGALPIPPSFHLQSRDLLQAGDLAKAKAFYAETVVLDKQMDVSKQVDAGILARITAPREILFSARRRNGSASTILKPQCSQCGKPDEAGTLLRCSRCKLAYYCSELCQRASWSTHRSVCAAHTT